MEYADKFVELLFKSDMTVSCAESCTGGMIASELVSYAGISDHFYEGIVTYSNESKHKYLKVKNETLDKYGAVSKECAAEMAKGIRLVSNSDISIISTGIAGPDGGTIDKPVGTVYLAFADKNRVIVQKHHFDGNRYSVRHHATKAAFKLLYERIKELI